MKQSHFAIATTRPVAVLMVVLAVVVFGYVSYQKLALTLMPDISYPALTVRTEYPGTAPQEVEMQISRRLEQELGIVPNLVELTSISQAGQSDILMDFAWGTDMSLAAQDIREKIDRVDLPEDVVPPLILRYDPTLDPVLRVGLSGPIPLESLRLVGEDILQRELEGVEGIAAVKVKGGLEEEYQVNVNEQRLVALGLDISQLNTSLAQNNVNLPGGDLREGNTRYIIRTLNEFESIGELGSIVIDRKDGADIYLRDVANIEKGFKEREVITLVNGLESVEIEIYKEADANVVKVAQRVRDRLFGTSEQANYVATLDKATNEPPVAKKESPRPGQNRQEERQALQRHRAMTDFVAYQLPEDFRIEILSDQSIFIKQALDEVKGNAIFGGAIAIVVLFFFLRHLGHTAIIGVTIPVSLVATFAPMYLFDVSLNIISLGGLALGVGMLVDNSIVVLESIFRCREEGDDLVPATVRGVSEVGGAVVASTLTTIAVFFPIVFVEGVAGQVFGDMALTVVFSLLASLIVGLYFIPMLASRSFGGKYEHSSAAPDVFSPELLYSPFRQLADSIGAFVRAFFRKSRFVRKLLGAVAFPLALSYFLLRFVLYLVFAIVGFFGKLLFGLALLLFVGLGKLLGGFLFLVGPFLRLFEIGFAKVQQAYGTLLVRALANRVSVVAVAFGLFALSVYFVFPQLGRELIPQVRQGEFNLNVRMPVGTPLERTAEAVALVEESVLDLDEVERVSTVIGSAREATTAADEGEHTARVTVTLSDGANRIAEGEVLRKIRETITFIPDLDFDISYPELFTIKAPIEVALFGYDLDTMKSLSQTVVERMSSIPGVVDVQSALQPGNPEVQIRYDREALSRLGLRLRSVAELIRNKVRGDVPTEFRKRDRDVDILVRLAQENRYAIEDLERIIVNPGEAVPIPLLSVAKLQLREGPSQIRHIDQERATVIEASVEGIDLSAAVASIHEALSDIEFPESFGYRIGGQSEEMDRSLKSLLFALALALFLVYIVMASQFESLLHPLIVLFTVPLAIIGVMVALYAGGWTINVLVFIGLIMLAGIVVNNAIVLIDYINTLRRRGFSKFDAVVEGCQARLRPILMTTLTTVLGLLPMAIGLGEASEIRVPLAITVIAGLTSSTVLTLVVIPSVYLILDYEKIAAESSADKQALQGSGKAKPIGI